MAAVRAARVARERRGVRRLLRPARADRAVRTSRDGRRDRRAAAGRRARAPRRAGGNGRRSSRSCSARSRSTASAGRRGGRSGCTRSTPRSRSTDPRLADLALTGFNLLGLIATIALVALALPRRRRVRAARLRRADVARHPFIGSLVPIALAYAIAHYFSLFVLQGQVTRRLVSDPFGFGWDLFGTRDFAAEPDRAHAEHDLVRPGRRARHRARPRRSCSRTTARSRSSVARGRAAHAVRDARADGRLHGRRSLAALERVRGSAAARRPARDSVSARRRGERRSRCSVRAATSDPRGFGCSGFGVADLEHDVRVVGADRRSSLEPCGSPIVRGEAAEAGARRGRSGPSSTSSVGSRCRPQTRQRARRRTRPTIAALGATSGQRRIA